MKPRTQSLLSLTLTAGLLLGAATAQAAECFDPGAMARDAIEHAKKLAKEQDGAESAPRARTDLIAVEGAEGPGVDARFRAGLIKDQGSRLHDRAEPLWLAFFEQTECKSARLAIIGINKYRILEDSKARIVYELIPDPKDIRNHTIKPDGKPDRLVFEKLGDHRVRVTTDNQQRQMGCDGKPVNHRVKLTQVVSWDFGKDPQPASPMTKLMLLSKKVAEESADLDRACGASAGQTVAEKKNKGELKEPTASGASEKTSANARGARQ